MKSIFKPLMLATVVATAGFLGACNDNNDNPTSPTTTSTPSPSPAATPEPTTSPSPEPTPGPEPGVGETVGFLGYVRDIQGSELNVSSKPVFVDADTQFVLEDNTPWSQAAVAIGDHVRIRGTVRADGGTDAQRVTKLLQ